MSYYYSNQAKYRDRGIDYDLCACLEHNDPGIYIDEIAKVLNVIEGENDGDDWVWTLQLNDGTVGELVGGCDYTGWDCQSWASWTPWSKDRAAEYLAPAEKPETWREAMDREFLAEIPVAVLSNEDLIKRLEKVEAELALLKGNMSE